MSDKESNVVRTGIPGYPGYAASADGRIWSYWEPGRWKRRLKIPRQLSTHINKDTGYEMARVKRRNGKFYTVAVHTLVLLAFKGPANGRLARHGPNGKGDNSSDNLSWGTSEENARDKFRDGTQPIGYTHHNAKLTPATVKQIFHWRRKGRTQAAIAAKLGVSQPTISAVLSGKARIVSHG